MKDFVKKNIFSILTVLFAISLGISTYFIATHFIQERQQASEFEELAQIVEQCPENDCDKAYSKELPILSDYAELYLQNEDMVGWISIPDTHINYPVMQTVDNPNYYLKKNFNHEYSDYGVPYIQENCNISTPSDNLIIYSHHMRNGTMFADLENYKSRDFFDNHRYIFFDTLTERGKYEIIAAFKTVVYSNSSKSFKYYEFVDAKTKEDFNSYVEKCRELSFYDTGVSAEYGDKLITLSTCEYSQTNGRLVVVAKKVME